MKWHKSATGLYQVAVNEGIVHIALVELRRQLRYHALVAPVQLKEPTGQPLLAELCLEGLLKSQEKPRDAS